MDCLTFKGVIRSGSGHYKELVFPNQDELDDAPNDWPGHDLYRGSLNVRVANGGYPDGFESPPHVRRLDNRQFQPAFVIPREAIANNKLGHRPDLPDGGDAQVWRAALQVVATEQSEDCWLVRRIGSGLMYDLEFVSDQHLRTALTLADDDPVIVEIFASSHL